MSADGTSFARGRAVRIASGFASVGMVAGVSLVAASPAAAAAPDCTGVTVDGASVGAELAVQTLLDANAPVVCLTGTFMLTTGFTFYSDLILYGLADAVLDGNDLVQLVANDVLVNSLTVENITFLNGAGEYGGAISAAEVTAVNSRFVSNGATIGGAIAGYTIDVTDSIFENNEALVGGAITAYNLFVEEDSSVSVTNSTFTQNEAAGGGAIFSYGVASVYSSTFDENFASDFGGAVVSSYGTYVENSTFVGNIVEGPGGALAIGYGGTVVQSTFLNNESAGGQSIFGYGGNVISLLGNIFAGSSSDPHLIADETTISDEGGNLFTTTQGTESNLSDVKPSTQFALTTLAIFNGATLADNGGPTQTVALYAGSPAINAVPAGSLSTDQRGTVRPAVSDAGAYEFVPAVLANTGSAPAGLLGGAAALLLAGAALVFGFARRSARTR